MEKGSQIFQGLFAAKFEIEVLVVKHANYNIDIYTLYDT